ncbi:hypothetical protein AG1IA_04846 [Rhizoctonia solani AG-1 IA]|uniref:Uncharacterized protein n=1 Tax=Thanatephorus cucumeris (strain AG1-IA) TaxID=983506 RepID=L8WWF7_THACA|nr:hypothetical protein AG1IA_04846 [Rhizoctonia solani AG-1 IA]
MLRLRGSDFRETRAYDVARPQMSGGPIWGTHRIFPEHLAARGTRGRVDPDDSHSRVGGERDAKNSIHQDGGWDLRKCGHIGRPSAPYEGGRPRTPSSHVVAPLQSPPSCAQIPARASLQAPNHSLKFLYQRSYPARSFATVLRRPCSCQTPDITNDCTSQ